MDTKITKAVKPEDIIAAKERAETATAVAAPVFAGGGRPDKSTTLVYPVEWNGATYSEVTARAFRGKDFKRFRMLSTMGVDPETALVSIIAGLPIEVVDGLEGDDYVAVAEMIEDFIPARFRAAGPESDPAS